MAVLQTLEDFIRKAKLKHGDKYDYSITEYVNTRSKIKIICHLHGVFEQKANSHLEGQGCKLCGNASISNKLKFTHSEFIEKCIKLHGNKYDYSLVEYINTKSKIKIICNLHGVFEQKAQAHILGHGCSRCRDLFLAKDTDYFINKSNCIHNNKYDYSESIYKNNHDKITIICPSHGKFFMKASHHYSGSGCKECMKEKFRLNINDFIEMANIVHDNKYDYSLVDYINNRIKVIIICDKHGEFNPTAGNHLRGSGCPKCNSSKGEILIRNFLKSHNIEHEEQKKFKECINIKPLIFDFYLPNLNTIIEYQGLQHFKIIKRAKNWTNQKCNSILKRIQENDSIKREWCKNNNVKLIEINYNDNNPLDVLSKGLLFV